MKGFFKKHTSLLYVIALQEAFTAIIPFFLLSSMVTLLFFSIKQFHMELFFIDIKSLRFLMNMLNSLTSVAAVISIAYFFSERLNTSKIMSVLLSIAVFITVLLFDGSRNPMSHMHGFTVATILVPIFATHLMKLFYPLFSLRISLQDGNRHIYRIFNYIFVFLASYFVLVGLCAVVNTVWQQITLLSWNFFFELPHTILFALKDLIIQIFWYFGLHGSHMANAILGTDIQAEYIVPHLTYGEFNRLFIMLGGTGAGAALLIALLFYSKERTFRTLAKISIPFVFFNINELLVYPVIVFNRSFFLPFVLIPLFNFAISYLFIHLIPIHFTAYKIVWTTPVFINAYLKSGGTFTLVFFQFFLLFIDTLIYAQFVKKFIRVQSYDSQVKELKENLNLEEELKAKEGFGAYIAHKEVISANEELYEMLPTLTEENLFVYYQPKVEVELCHCQDYEALIRYRHEGKINGPFFLDTIEKAGLAPIIDIWVSQQIKNDLLKWEKEDFLPRISINLHPDTLLNDNAITIISENLLSWEITIEIVERSFLFGTQAISNLKRLQNNGFLISIDDFGIGYSNLETIVKYEIEELKLDKSLIDKIETRNGYLVCKKIVELCHEIGYKVVAEGVETETQYLLVKEIGTDYIQGFYFSQALPSNKIKYFIPCESR